MNPKRDKPHGPEELAAVLKTQSPVFVVGGQAVNLWALHYYQNRQRVNARIVKKQHKDVFFASFSDKIYRIYKIYSFATRHILLILSKSPAATQAFAPRPSYSA